MSEFEMESVEWYHGSITRHIAEALLIANGREGSFLLRDVPDGYCLSVRGRNSVKHFKIEQSESGITFAHTSFDDMSQLLQVLANQVILCSSTGSIAKDLEQGTLVTLNYPYPTHIEEPDNYEEFMMMHSTIQVNATLDDLNKQAKPVPLASKSGFLTKRGDSFKSWKLRWIVIVRNDLSYYTDRTSEKPIRTLNLENCYKLSRCTCPGKEYCFILEFPDRNWYFSASSEDDLKEWTQIIEWKLDQNRQSSISQQLPKMSRVKSSSLPRKLTNKSF